MAEGGVPIIPGGTVIRVAQAGADVLEYPHLELNDASAGRCEVNGTEFVDRNPRTPLTPMTPS